MRYIFLKNHTQSGLLTLKCVVFYSKNCSKTYFWHNRIVVLSHYFFAHHTLWWLRDYSKSLFCHFSHVFEFQISFMHPRLVDILKRALLNLKFRLLPLLMLLPTFTMEESTLDLDFWRDIAILESFVNAYTTSCMTLPFWEFWK